MKKLSIEQIEKFSAGLHPCIQFPGSAHVPGGCFDSCYIVEAATGGRIPCHGLPN